jgi:hypothetical protein
MAGSESGDNRAKNQDSECSWAFFGKNGEFHIYFVFYEKYLKLNL